MTGQAIFNIVAGTGLAGSQALLFRALFAAARDRTIRVVVDIEGPLGGRTQFSPEDLARAAEGATSDDGIAAPAGKTRGLR